MSPAALHPEADSVTQSNQISVHFLTKQRRLEILHQQGIVFTRVQDAPAPPQRLWVSSEGLHYNLNGTPETECEMFECIKH